METSSLPVKEFRRRMIKAYLILGGNTEAQISRNAGVSREMVNKVIRGIRKSDRVIDALRNAGIPETLLCPGAAD